jgi:hypothetical protein
MYVEGPVEIVRSGKTTPAQQDMEVLIKDSLRTGKKAYTGIRFSDESIIDMAPETEIAVADYTVEENRQNSVIEMTTGFIHSRIREMAAGFFGLKKNRWEVHTQTAVVGVRGTDINVRVGPVEGPTKEALTECLVKRGLAYAFVRDLVLVAVNITAGQSFIALSASKPGSVGLPSAEMQKITDEMFDKEVQRSIEDPSRFAPPRAEDVTIKPGDFKACDREIAKAEKAIAAWDAQNLFWEGWVLKYFATIIPGTVTLVDAVHAYEAASFIQRSRKERDKWKKFLEDIKKIKETMKKRKESSGGGGGGGGNGH